jgi:hypothetical protein
VVIRAVIAVAALGIALLPVPIARERAVVPVYDAVWLWAGVRAQPALATAKRLYLLQGQVEATDPVRYAAQRAAIPRLGNREVWMVVRVETLAWTPAIYDQMLAALGRWRAAGNRVVGVQIDFDARTRHLEDYAAFLRGVRGRLPSDCRLGITGLLDWSANGDPKGLDALAGVVDEAVLQIYQGDHVIPGYQAYLVKLDRLKLPFRIGLLQGGEWQPTLGLEANPWFRGYVTFLRNPPEEGPD